MLTFRKCHNLQNSLLIIKKVFICCYSAGQIQNKKSIREYLKGLKRQPPVLATPLVNLALGATLRTLTFPRRDTNISWN